jgi:hypothetical protein
MPYGKLTADEWELSSYELLPIDLSGIYAGLGLEALGEQYCSSDSCEIKDYKLDHKEEVAVV